MLRPLVAALAAVSLLAPPALAAEPRPVTLDEALASAREHNPRLHAQDAAIDAAKAERAAGRARFLPLLRVEGNVMLWDSDQSISFTGDEGGGFDLSLLPAPATPYEFVVSELLKGLSTPTKVRDQVTAQLSV